MKNLNKYILGAFILSVGVNLFLLYFNSNTTPANQDPKTVIEQRKIQEIIDNAQDGQDKNKGPAIVDNACMYKNVTYKTGEGYFDGCNWHTCQDDGTFFGTEIGCEEYADPKNSWEQ